MTRDEARMAAAAAVKLGAGLTLPAPRRLPSEQCVGPPAYSARLSEAFAYAAEQHREQVRKGTRIPYVTHLWGVASLVGEHGGNEDQMIAALLHDAVEDTGGEPVLVAIRERFGEAVAAIVSACSDDTAVEQGGKRPWLERKSAYLQHLADAPRTVLLVSACDKLHNLRSILGDLNEVGTAVFDRFKAGRVGTVWYYRSLAEIFAAIAATENDAGLDRLARELRRGVDALEAAAPE